MHLLNLLPYIKGNSEMCVYGDLYRCIVACTHLGNSTGHRTVTMAVPLLLTSSPVRYRAELQKMSLQWQCQVQRFCFGKELFTYVYMRIYIYIYMDLSIYEELFSKI